MKVNSFAIRSMQLLAAIVMVAAVLGTILNDCYWIDADGFQMYYIGEWLMYLLILVGSILLSICYFNGEKRLYKIANICLALAFLERFIDVCYQCIATGDVPWYALFIFGLPSAIALLFEIIIIGRIYAKGVSEYGNWIVLVVCVLQVILLSVGSIGIVHELIEAFSVEAMSQLHYITLLITNVTLTTTTVGTKHI